MFLALALFPVRRILPKSLGEFLVAISILQEHRFSLQTRKAVELVFRRNPEH